MEGGKGIYTPVRRSESFSSLSRKMAALTESSYPTRPADELSAVSHHEEASSHSPDASLATALTSDQQSMFEQYDILIESELGKLVKF